MKIRNLCTATAVAIVLAFGTVSYAADAVVSTTTSEGTISEFSPDSIVIRSERATEPMRYTYSKSTTYVDDAGAPVSIETVKSGLPVTVHYVREGDRTIARRVIVHKRTTTTAPAAVEERRSTTTTTTTREK